MFIVWGRRLTYRKLGYVADFCSLCRAPRPFRLQRVGSVGHLYYISFGKGDLVRHERECQECRATVVTAHGNYATVATKLLPLAELMHETFPNFNQALQRELALEEKIRFAPQSLTREERAELLRTPFAVLSPKVEERYTRLVMDKGVWIALIGAILMMGSSPSIASVILPDRGELLLLAAIVLGVVAVIWQLAMARRRFVRREILPLLAKCLRPLKPQQSELQAVLAELKQRKHKMGTKLSLAELSSAFAVADLPS